MNQAEPLYQMPPQPILPVITIIAILAVGWLFAGTAIRRYTGVSRGMSILLWLLAVGLSVGLIVYKRRVLHHSGDAAPFIIPCSILLPLLALPFVVRLYRKWIGGDLTDAEKLPGMDGVRAWLGMGNAICAVSIPLCAWQVFGVSPLPIAALTFGALLAYPLLNMASHPDQPAPAAPSEDLSSEREKVLQLLESGKISAADSAELLNALTHSAPPPKPATEINPQRKLVLIGAAVLLLGFFLPWFTINPGEEMNRAMSQFQQGQQMPMPFNNPTPTVQACGGDIGHGLGWWILALGVAAAVLPFFASNLDPQTQKKVMIASLGVGAVLLIYLFTNAWRHISFGILLALAGYALELVGTLRERPAVR